MNVRDWLFVSDHASALWQVLTHGAVGSTYNIGSNHEQTNLQLVELLCDLIDELAPRLGCQSRSLIAFVKDRPGHDRRYATDSSKMAIELGWQPVYTLERGLRETVQWYLKNQEWVHRVLNQSNRKLTSDLGIATEISG